ncbi:MAG: creatininase family protein [Pseudomonadota bacterium]
MSLAKRVWWGDFTAREFEDLNPHETLAVLPIAATEQHGPHLPVSTDHAIMHGMLSMVFPILPDDLDARFLPVQCIGKSNEHIRVPGTLTMDATTIIDAWTQIGDSVARAGIRKLVIINSHGGNEELMGIVAREMRVRHDMLAVKTSWNRFGFPDNMFSDDNRAHGIHGDDYETSLMLHFAPHTVEMDQAQDFTSSTPRARQTFKHLAPQSPHAYAWIAGDINADGVAGEAHLATAEKGAATAAHQARAFVDLLADVRAMRLEDWLTG